MKKMRLLLPSSRSWHLIVLFIHFRVTLNTDDIEGGLGKGLGENFSWMKLEEGLIASRMSNKPLMLIIHKSWCGACKVFKPKFAESKEIAELSSQFIMVNTQDEEEPSDPKYSPDGSYIPRILFLNPIGDVMLDVYNESGNKNYRYYYYDADSVIGSMRKALLLVNEVRTLPDEL